MDIGERTLGLVAIAAEVDEECRIFLGGDGVGKVTRFTGVDENENGSGRVTKSLLQID